MPHPTQGHLPQRPHKALPLLCKQPVPQDRTRPPAVAHRDPQANASARATLENRVSEIRRTLANYQRYFVWSIENRNHYVRDVAFDEDASRIRHNPGTMARARSFALNIMRKNHITNVAQALWAGAVSLDHILAYKAI